MHKYCVESKLEKSQVLDLEKKKKIKDRGTREGLKVTEGQINKSSTPKLIVAFAKKFASSVFCA